VKATSRLRRALVWRALLITAVGLTWAGFIFLTT
jgi:hypothetical protein